MATYSDLGLFETLNTAVQDAQRAALAGRIPGATALEEQSSKDIASLLDPGMMFMDTSRKAAELGTGRGVGGSAGAFGVGLRMSDQERLNRMTLGQNMLTQATARNPIAALPDILQTIITPYQKRLLNLKQQEQDLNEQWLAFQRSIRNQSGMYPTIRYSGSPTMGNASLTRGLTSSGEPITPFSTASTGYGGMMGGYGAPTYGGYGGTGGGMIIDSSGNLQNYTYPEVGDLNWAGELFPTTSSGPDYYLGSDSGY